jgi:PKD repeat protein
MNGKKIIFNNDALSVVVSGLLSIIIVTSTIGTILTVGVPLVNTINAEKNKNNIELQFNSLFNSIADISKSSKIGDTKQINFQLDKDSQLVVNEEKDVSVFMYSLNPSYEFSVSGLDNGDNSFYVKMLDGSLTNADIFWLFNPETCFLAGTKILMFDGNYKNIEDIKVGDFVRSYNTESGKIENCKVIKTFVHQPDEMPAFYLILNNYLRVTPNHRFYSEGNWVFAGNLKIGDKLFSYNNLDDYFIYSIKKVYNRVTTFDLEIEKSHTYFVSINQKIDVLVHNGGEKNQAPRTPTLMEPTDGATDISIQPTLIWRGGDDDIEDFVQYQIYYGLSDNPPLVYTTDFFPGEIQDFEYAIEEPLVFSSIYCWKIIAIDKLGATSESLVFTFRTESDDLLPVADFTYSPNFPNQGQTVYFDARISQGNIIEYEWDFDGQGYKPGGITPTYSWQSSGSKTVKLKVTDDRNNIAYKTKTITINQRPSVTISSPASGATVSGSILITGSASDSDGSIVSVQVSIDDTNNWYDASVTYESFPNVILGIYLGFNRS